MRIVAFVGAAAVGLSGCASITKGTDQDVAVNTNPQGARCELVREGAPIAVVDPTPATVNVDKDKDDIQITCALEGYEEARYVLDSEAEAMTAGNVLFGGVIGLAIDAGTGAMNRYDSNVTVIMQREEPAPAPATLIN
jgi:hypothetical protein